jgi:hypothetical protein
MRGPTPYAWPHAVVSSALAVSVAEVAAVNDFIAVGSTRRSRPFSVARHTDPPKASSPSSLFHLSDFSVACAGSWRV